MFNRRRACTQGENKGRDNTLGRHCANRAQLRRQGASAPTERDTQGSKTKSPFCVVLKTYHLDTWILHKTCLKHSNFLNRKFCAQSFPLGTSWQQQWDRELKKTQQVRQGSKHGNYNMLPCLIGRDLRTASSSSNLRIPLHPLDLPHSPEASNLGSRTNEAIVALNRIAMSGTYVNTSCANREKTKHFAKRGKQQQHGST